MDRNRDARAEISRLYRSLSGTELWPPDDKTAYWLNSGCDDNADLYRQAARYIRRPAPKRDPWLAAAVTAWVTGSAIAVILAAEQNTPWWLTALIPVTVLVTIGLVRAMDR